MPAPENAKKPADRKPKSENVDCFTFTHDGVEHTLRPTYDVLTPGFMRANRRRDDLDAFFTILEALADADTLDVIDNMTRAEFKDLQDDFYKHLEVATTGE